jgi:hypothetical protein
VARLLFLVADYGTGDRAFAALAERLALAAPEIDIVLSKVPPSDTVAAGYCVAHLALIPGPAGRLVVHDVAPPAADGGCPKLCFGRTAAGAEVIGADAGFAWSFVAPHVSGPCYLEVPADIPSRCAPEHLAAAVVRVIDRHPHAIAGAVPHHAIEPPPATARALADRVDRLASRLKTCEPRRLAHRPPLGSSLPSRPAAAGTSSTGLGAARSA